MDKSEDGNEKGQTHRPRLTKPGLLWGSLTDTFANLEQTWLFISTAQGEGLSCLERRFLQGSNLRQ